MLLRMSDMVAKESPQARQINIPSGKIFLHRGHVSSGIASIDTYRQRVRFPSAAGSKCLLIETIRTAFPRVVRCNLKACCSHRRFPRHAQQVVKSRGRCLFLGSSSSTTWYDLLVDKRPTKRHDVLPLGVLVDEEHLQRFEVRTLVAFKFLVCGSALPSLVLFPDESVLGCLLPKVLLDPVVAVIGPKVLRLLAIECVDEAMVRDPVFADEGSGQGFHQANTIVQSTIGVDCDAQRSIRPDTRILAFNFPRRMTGHVGMTLA